MQANIIQADPQAHVFIHVPHFIRAMQQVIHEQLAQVNLPPPLRQRLQAMNAWLNRFKPYIQNKKFVFAVTASGMMVSGITLAFYSAQYGRIPAPVLPCDGDCTIDLRIKDSDECVVPATIHNNLTAFSITCFRQPNNPMSRNYALLVPNEIRNSKQAELGVISNPANISEVRDFFSAQTAWNITACTSTLLQTFGVNVALDLGALCYEIGEAIFCRLVSYPGNRQAMYHNNLDIIAQTTNNFEQKFVASLDDLCTADSLNTARSLAPNKTLVMGMMSGISFLLFFAFILFLYMERPRRHIQRLEVGDDAAEEQNQGAQLLLGDHQGGDHHGDEDNPAFVELAEFIPHAGVVEDEGVVQPVDDVVEVVEVDREQLPAVASAPANPRPAYAFAAASSAAASVQPEQQQSGCVAAIAREESEAVGAASRGNNPEADAAPLSLIFDISGRRPPYVVRHSVQQPQDVAVDDAPPSVGAVEEMRENLRFIE